MIRMPTRVVLMMPIVLTLASCGWFGDRTIEGSGQLVRETLAFDAFTGVSFSLPGHLVIEQGSSDEVTIETDENVIEHIRVQIRAGRLEIHVAEGVRIRPNVPLRVFVVAEDLASLSLAGAGTAEVLAFDAHDFSVSLAGSGSVVLDQLWATELTISTAGSGGVTASGTAERQTISIAGSGGVDAAEMDSREVDVQIAGSGSARLHVTERLAARIAGSGSVRYSGDPELSTSILGSGRVERVDD